MIVRVLQNKMSCNLYGNLYSASIVLHYKNGLVMKPQLVNFSDRNMSFAVPELESPAVKFLFENKSPHTPECVLITLKKNNSNGSMPYNIYPGTIKNYEANYFWNNKGALTFSSNYMSLYISHSYLFNYDFPDNVTNFEEYVKEYNIDCSFTSMD